MKLKTSLFNKTVLKKDITRFAPVWGLYTVFMLMTLFLIWAEESEPAQFASGASTIMTLMGIVNFVYAGLCTVLLFGDLFSSKMCNALHAMPMRREGWFLTHFTAGMLFCIVPNSLGAVLAAAILQEYCYLAFIWLAIMLCQFLFFFGVGAFSMFCAGNRIGATAVYALFNFLSVLAAFLVYTFYAPVLYGIEPDLEAMFRCSPVVGFSTFRYVTVKYDNMTGSALFQGFVSQNWRFLFICAAIGIALLAAAVLLYRRRQMESAGDFIAVKPVAPVFLVLYTLCVGAVLYFIADQLNTDAQYLFLLIGFAIGFFTGWMLLEKKVNVFKPKKFLGFSILTFVFFLTIALTWMDPLGLTRYVPDADQVEKVEIAPYASSYYLDTRNLSLYDPEDIETITDIHTELVKNRTANDHGFCLQLRYHLKDGTLRHRKYYLDENNPVMSKLKPYFSDYRYITQTASVEQLLQRAETIEFHSHTNQFPSFSIIAPNNVAIEEKYGDDDWLSFPAQTTLDQYPLSQGLLQAVLEDCRAGTMAQQWEFHKDGESVGSMVIRYAISSYQTRYVDLTVFADCANTDAFLRQIASTAKTD